jgi:hypothetical protein
MGEGTAAQQKIIQTMEKAGEGSRGIVVATLDGGRHAFNVVVQDGYAFFLDEQTGGFFANGIWQHLDGILLFLTSGGK